MKLTDIKCRSAKPSKKSFKVADGGGMYLEVMPNGSKYWRLKYRIKVEDKLKEKRLALGIYPEISLKEARDRREDAKKYSYIDYTNNTIGVFYCGYDLQKEKPTLDHFYPKSLSTHRDIPSNTVACCLSCNQDKGDRLLTIEEEERKCSFEEDPLYLDKNIEDLYEIAIRTSHHKHMQIHS